MTFIDMKAFIQLLALVVAMLALGGVAVAIAEHPGSAAGATEANAKSLK